MAEMTPAQIERLKQQQINRFKKMGFPVSAGQMMDIPVENLPEQRVYESPAHAPIIKEQSETQQSYNTTLKQTENEAQIAQQLAQQLAEERVQKQSSMYTAPRDKINTLEQIKRGAKKNEFNSFIKAEHIGVNGNQIPEVKSPKRQNRPGQLQEKTKNPIAPQEFSARGGSEFNMIEDLFTDKSTGINICSNGELPQGNLINVHGDYSDIGPTFDPVRHLQEKAKLKGIDINLTDRKVLNENQVFKAESDDRLEQMMLMMEAFTKNQQKNIGYNSNELKELIVIISKKVAEITMKKLLKEYAETQKKKKFYEVVVPEKNIVKTSENLYFQMIPVKVKSKS